MSEQWLPIAGYTDYSVSDHGRVRNNRTGRILRQCPRGRSNLYLGVNLWRLGRRKPFLVHRLVAKAFLPPSTNWLANEVNHFDCDPTNNHVSNLEWVTRWENEAHKRFMEATA
ncbi:MAG TPA: NUMOD4 domain-containing protein [Spirochaetia bacterium]|nr:NUMOD4 domain-containing protein [Spirochaetia bacterium]